MWRLSRSAPGRTKSTRSFNTHHIDNGYGPTAIAHVRTPETAFRLRHRSPETDETNTERIVKRTKILNNRFALRDARNANGTYGRDCGRDRWPLSREQNNNNNNNLMTTRLIGTGFTALPPYPTNRLQRFKLNYTAETILLFTTARTSNGRRAPHLHLPEIPTNNQTFFFFSDIYNPFVGTVNKYDRENV